MRYTRARCPAVWVFALLALSLLPGAASLDTLKRSDIAPREDYVRNPAHRDPARVVPVQATNAASTEFGLLGRDLHQLSSRQALLCSPGNACIDGSCCGPQNKCGYGPDYCGTGCTSYCNATAMCGKYSENGSEPCGMKLCCSAMGWCGTTEPYCGNADPVHGSLPCQEGFGSCAIAHPKSCPTGGGSTSGRTIGYYQSWNVKNRTCHKVWPKQLNTTGFTHLNYAFATINPTTFEVSQVDPGEEALMLEFTSLQSRGLETWIAIGGFDFSNPDAPTHTTWSDLCASADARATFISSVISYMDRFGFNGVDLDWEYPGEPARGGRRWNDTHNFVLLLQEMRAAFSQSDQPYKISLTLAPDPWYLRWFDGKGLEPYVDFFGFMAYDLHGFWDADVTSLGKLVRGQADIREISNDTTPLWFDGLDPAKINFGLAMYGRGYTLADKSCNQLGCPFSGPSLPGACTNFNGVMSLVEINQVIRDKGITPQYLPDAMMKQITWDDQWIGYDDEETFAAKKAWADGLCFGGVMYWSIDFQDTSSGSNGPVISLAPDVYKGAPAQCTAPCEFVFAPSPLASATTISIPPYTTSLEVRPGSITTITVTIPAITTTEVQFYNMNITSGEPAGTFRPLVSVDVPPIVVTIPGDGGGSQTRTLHLPPYPSITQGPPSESFGWGNGNGDPWAQDPRPDLPLQSDTPFPSPTKTPYTPIGAETTTTTTPLVVVTPWPTDAVTPVTTPVPDDGEYDGQGGYTISCHQIQTILDLFFMWDACFSLGNFTIFGYRFKVPKSGEYGPGPPSMRGIDIHGTDWTWPPIDIELGSRPSASEKPDNCETKTAPVCRTTTSFGATTTKGTITTTITDVKGTCATISGCAIRESDATTTIESACPTPTNLSVDLVNDSLLTGRRLVKRVPPPWRNYCGGGGGDGIILPTRPEDDNYQARIRALLSEREQYLHARGIMTGRTYEEIRAIGFGFTAYFHVKLMDDATELYLNSAEVPEIYNAYRPQPWRQTTRRDIKRDLSADVEGNATSKSTSLLEKRVNDHRETVDSKIWHLSQLSMPPSYPWYADTPPYHLPSKGQFGYFFDTSLGAGQRIYNYDQAIDKNHPELLGMPGGYRELLLTEYGIPLPKGSTEHGTVMAAFATGSILGIARNAELVLVQKQASTIESVTSPVWVEYNLQALVNIANDLETNWVSSTINWSHSFKNAGGWYEWAWERLMLQMCYRYHVVFTVASGNFALKESNGGPGTWDVGNRVPQKFGPRRTVSGLILVGASTQRGDRWRKSQGGPGPNGEPAQVDVYAPGNEVPTADLPLPPPPAKINSGTSISSAIVAGLVAYLKGNPNYVGGRDPASMRASIRALSHPLVKFVDEPPNYPGVNIVWNGQTFMTPCLINPLAAAAAGLQSRQDAGPSCPLLRAGGNGGPEAVGPPVSFRPGPPGPICSAHCGKLCTGFWCVPNQTGLPPDFSEPSTSSGGGQVSTINPTQDPVATGLPPLDPTSSSDQACMATTTFKQCAAGPGGQSACATTSSCVQWADLPTTPVVATLTTTFVVPPMHTDGAPWPDPHGTVDCNFNSPSGSVSNGDVEQAMKQFISNCQQSGATFGYHGTNYQAISYKTPDSQKTIAVSGQYSAPQGSDCPLIDFSQKGTGDEVTIYLEYLIKQCPAASQGTQKFTWGGTLVQDCITWNISLI